MTDIRSPICVVVGHVDHGKSSILDKIRGTAIVSTEAGKITQAIGSSIIPMETIEKLCGTLLKTLKIKFTIPGLLFIDTPGHAAFTSLRKRGGTLADIAILVIDINEGFKPQTAESVEIMKQFKTPFVVAANKIDLLPGWQDTEGTLLKKMQTQSESTKQLLDKKIYEIVGKLHEYGFESERFDRIGDYTKQVPIVPVSAKTGNGLEELLMVTAGLAQRFLESSLKLDIHGKAKGTIMEVKEVMGKGFCMDVIIYDGTLNVNDTIVIGGTEEPIVTKVKAMLEPVPLSEMRDKKSKFENVKAVTAATGVRIMAPMAEQAIAGMPLMSVKENLEEIKKHVQSMVEDVFIKTEKKGIILKADTIGSLEAMIKLLKEKDVPIRKATIGNISKKDIADAESNYEKDPLKAVILGFNISLSKDVLLKKVKIITHDIIYKIIEDFEEWEAEERKRQEALKLEGVIKPCKLQILKNYVFRQSNPAIVGCSIIAGVLKTGMPLMKNGKEITSVKSIQHDKENLEKAEQGKQVAVSMDNVTVGRQINEGDIMYSAIPEEDFTKLKKLKKYLTKEEIEVIKEIAEIMRKENSVWGI